MKTYIIDPQTFAINFYDDAIEQVEPYQFQPCYPNGDKFDSVAEAKQWAELSIAAHNADVMEYAPNGKDLAPELKPDSLAKEKLLTKLGITADEAKLLLS